MANPTPLTIAPAYILTSAGVAQGQLDTAFQASDPVNGNSFTSSGKDMLVVQNTDVAQQTFTIKSAADQFGRYADITYNVAASAFAMVVISSAAIYTQADGTVRLTSTSANLKFLPVKGA